VLGFARREAALARESRLLIAEIAAHRHALAEGPVGRRVAVGLARDRRKDRRERRARRDAEALAPARIAPPLPEPAHGRAGGGGRVGHERAAARPAREMPDHPGVDGAEAEVAREEQGAHLRLVLEEPSKLRRREVRRDWKPRAPADVLIPSLLDRGAAGV